MFERGISQRLSWIKELENIYQYILQAPSFDLYEEHAATIDDLYEKLSCEELTEMERAKLVSLYNMHQQIVDVISKELAELKQEQQMFERKKNASTKYNQSPYSSDAYFLDKKR
ncbi:hypothetical protein [Paenibacillus sp. 481]|uniref:hypothetical protein n=1 Tax=Paenibacillus sp. 481 TaxID=2835869 RepID=UPI001E456858|nr:hypothetical protein [Paenibacillus sp. 481]UHA75716.1 hypothetical protein KIK04_12400 [Paenibacillus sp. 481]